MGRIKALVALLVLTAAVLALNLHVDAVRAEAIQNNVDVPCASGMYFGCLFGYLD